MNDFLIQFNPPSQSSGTALRNDALPPRTRLHLPYAQQSLLRWGVEAENFVYQQFYRGSDFAIAAIDIEVNEATILELVSSSAFNGLQYTLKGYSFGGLTGYGCLPLFKDTYTLQYVPQGRHSLLLPQGHHCYFYINPGKLLDNLGSQHQPIQQIAGLPDAMATTGRLITRLPITDGLRKLINGFTQFPDANANTALLIESSINTLIRYYHNQALTAEATILTPEQMMVFLAQHLQIPVPQLLTNLKKNYYTSISSLQRCWRKRYKESFRGFATRMRMTYALHLLTNGQNRISDVITQIGYLNPSDFSRQFRKAFSYPPSIAAQHILH